MVTKADKERIRALLSEAITVLCKNGLGYQTEFSVEGLLGITVDKEEIFLVNIKESILRGQRQEEKNGYDAKSNSGDYSDQDLSFGSTLEGVTGEFIEVGHANNSNNNNNNRRLSKRRASSSGSTHHLSGRSQSMGSAIKVEQSESRHEAGGGVSQAAILAGDLVLANTPWEPSLAGSSLTVSQAVAVSAPMVAASISQMSGIAQPTQLDEQRRRSREHMRRYRQQLRTTNYTEYEDRKRRQREGMRRYRERLRMEHPEKYAEMNRKHAEQERRRRMRVRSFSASFAQQAAAHQSLQAAMQTADSGGGGAGGGGAGAGVSVAGKLATTDFLHMAMENSQLLPVRDMHQLMQTGFPLGVAGAPGPAVGLSPSSISLPGGSSGSAGVGGNGGNGALIGLTAVSMKDDSHSQETSSHLQSSSSHPQLISREQSPGGVGHLHQQHHQQHQHHQQTTPGTQHSLAGHNNAAIQQSLVLPSASSASSVTTSPGPGGPPPHYSQGGQRAVAAPDGQHGHHSHEPPLRAHMEAAPSGGAH